MVANLLLEHIYANLFRQSIATKMYWTYQRNTWTYCVHTKGLLACIKSLWKWTMLKPFMTLMSMPHNTYFKSTRVSDSKSCKEPSTKFWTYKHIEWSNICTLSRKTKFLKLADYHIWNVLQQLSMFFFNIFFCLYFFNDKGFEY